REKRIPFVPEDQKEISASKIKEIYNCGDPVQFLSKRYTKQKGILDIFVSAALIKDSQNKPIGLVVNLTDISEQKRLERQLIQAQKMESVGRLAGGVAHDFNNMLGVILGNTELILEDLDPDNPIFDNLKEIQNATRRSTDFVRQLLAFARKQTISPRLLNLNTTMEGMLKMLQRLIGEDLELTWSPGKKLWPIKIDPSQIDQVLANLCVNARDAIKGVGKVTIETENISFDEAYCSNHTGFRPGDYVMLVFSDNGCGMDKETLSNLFEPFFTTKDVGEGTGLGLSTIYGIIKQNTGFINVYSEPDQGSTFKIFFPRHKQTITKAKTRHSETTAEIGNETILLVEDEKSILKLTSIMLQRLGYNVVSASSPNEAVRIAEEPNVKDIHLLITDVIMPEMNGRDLSEKLLKSYPDLKCLFMSGYTANVIAHHGVLDEKVAFINKPFSKQDLAKKIREVLKNSKD
ncbi:MAG: response regulator, partial [Desulfobacteraceae bacterium]|nr:response regulator [Desulfobacteraceae bacterium]